jgi:CheY-like chemotaxis protein
MVRNYEVLFVDDELNVLSALKRGLKEEEYTCHFASSAKEALKIMEKKNIAVIVTDMRMPEMNGLSLLKEIKEKWPQTVRVVLSGYTQLSQMLTTINQAYVYKFIAKPWKMEEEFIFVIRDALDYYKLIKENEQNKVALENKNRAYQNILKSIESKIAEANKRSEVIGECGKIIFNFRKHHESIDYEKFLEMGEKTYQRFLEAVRGEEKIIHSETLALLMSNLINSTFKVSEIDQQIKPGIPYTFSLDLIKFAVYNSMDVFFEEFKKNICYLRFDIVQEGFMAITLMLENVFSHLKPEIQENYPEWKLKIDYVNEVLVKLLGLFKIGFFATRKNESLVILLRINPS